MSISDRSLQMKKGGQALAFFTWVTAQRFLDFYAPGWSSRTIVSMSPERVAATVEISIPTSEAGIVTRSASGDDQEDDDEMDEREQRQRQSGAPWASSATRTILDVTGNQSACLEPVKAMGHQGRR